jgi:hypothetical protein
VIGGDVESESLLDEEGEGVHGGGDRTAWWCGQGAGNAGGKDDDTVDAELHRLADRGVVGDAAVEQRLPVDGDGREHTGDGCRGERRLERVATIEDDLGTGQHVGCHDVDGDDGILESVVGEVGLDEAAQPVGTAERRGGAGEREQVPVR